MVKPIATATNITQLILCIYGCYRLYIVDCGLTNSGATAVGEALKQNTKLTVLELPHVS